MGSHLHSGFLLADAKKFVRLILPSPSGMLSHREKHMFTRRQSIFGALAFAGCTSLPRKNDPISDEEYEIIGQLWSSARCNDEDFENYYVLQTLRLFEEPADSFSRDNFSSNLQRAKTSRVAASNPGLLNQTVDNLYKVNSRSLPISSSRFIGLCGTLIDAEQEFLLSTDIAENEDDNYRNRTKIIV